MLSSFLRHLKSRLLLPILVTVLVLIVLQVVIALWVTQYRVDGLVDDVQSTLLNGDQQVTDSLGKSKQTISLAIDNLSSGTENALNSTLSAQLGEEQKRVEQLLVESLHDTANAMANLMALAAPNAIWDGDSPRLTRLVNDLHRNDMVLFARYYDKEGNPLTRFLDKRKPKVLALIKSGEGRGSFNKLLNAAIKDPSVYVVDVEINPRGAVIGRFVLGVSNDKALQASEALSVRFTQLIGQSKKEVNQAVAVEAQVTSNAVDQAISQTNQISTKTSETLKAAIAQEAGSLLKDLSSILMLLGVIIIVLLTVVFSSRVVSKINRLTDSLNELAEGEGDLTQQIDIKSNDEIGDMAAAVNQFVIKTRELVLQANGAAEKVSGHLRELNLAAEDADGASNRQEEKMSQVSEAMSEMVSTIHQVSERIQDNLMNVDNIRSAANDASKISTSVSHSISDMVSQVQGAAETVSNVSELSAQIECVLDIISGIAEQTNLLALNAAIEAARAGDSGRGFAVVADEVRTLASKTQQSTESIQQQISELQAGVAHAVTVINQASDRAGKEINEIQRSDNQIQGMSASIQNLYDLTNDIAAMAEEQSQVSDEISHNLSDISHESGITSMSVSRNRELVQALDETATGLKSTLSRFKV